MSNSFGSISGNMLARKGEAKPSEEPRFGSMPWSAPKTGAAPGAAPPASLPTPANEPGVAGDAKVRLDQLASAWPTQKPARSSDEGSWVPNKPSPPLDGSSHPVKTTIRLTHAQARAVRLAAIVLDRPQQEILTQNLMSQLETLACTDLANCNCFKAVIEGLAEARHAEDEDLVDATGK
jgi:hypothetical protein